MHYWHTLGKMDIALNSINDHDDEVVNMVASFRANNGYHPDVNDLVMDDISITVNDVKQTINEAKNNKPPGLDLITNELLKNGGDGLVTSLTKLFNRILILESTLTEWNKGIIVPIYNKNSIKME